MILIIGAVALIGGAFYYFRIYKKKHHSMTRMKMMPRRRLSTRTPPMCRRPRIQNNKTSPCEYGLDTYYAFTDYAQNLLLL